MSSDGIPREGDVCSYTSVLYLASLAALEKLAVAYGNQTLAARCRTSKAKALAAVERLLWTGTHFRGFACDGSGVADSNIQGADRELARTLLSAWLSGLTLCRGFVCPFVSLSQGLLSSWRRRLALRSALGVNPRPGHGPLTSTAAVPPGY